MTRGLGGHSPANVQKFLAGVQYPARKEDLIRQARQNQAPEDIIDMIEGFPGDQYGGPQDVMKAYGGEQ
jgi:hypothetical protein